jgi:hypothetical protein
MLMVWLDQSALLLFEVLDGEHPHLLDELLFLIEQTVETGNDEGHLQVVGHDRFETIDQDGGSGLDLDWIVHTSMTMAANA